MADEQYSYRWTPESPEVLAHLRNMAGTATVDDLLFLALVNTTTADEALPPWATGPDKNNSGNAFMPDPWHASACAERAGAYLRQAREKLHVKAP